MALEHLNFVICPVRNQTGMGNWKRLKDKLWRIVLLENMLVNQDLYLFRKQNREEEFPGGPRGLHHAFQWS
jgi:hypothetical protein